VFAHYFLSVVVRIITAVTIAVMIVLHVTTVTDTGTTGGTAAGVLARAPRGAVTTAVVTEVGLVRVRLAMTIAVARPLVVTTVNTTIVVVVLMIAAMTDAPAVSVTTTIVAAVMSARRNASMTAPRGPRTRSPLGTLVEHRWRGLEKCLITPETKLHVGFAENGGGHLYTWTNRSHVCRSSTWSFALTSTPGYLSGSILAASASRLKPLIIAVLCGWQEHI
jgi:hypothetical protein